MQQPPNLYICRSPLQLLNCMEACESLGRTGAGDILICGWRTELDRQLMQRQLDLYKNWSEVHFFSLYPTKNQLPVMLQVFRKRRHFNNLFVGDTTHLINFFINKIGRFESIHLVDDGTATLRLANLISSKKLHALHKKNKPRNRLSSALQHRLGLSPSFMYNAKLFTFYRIQHPSLVDRIVSNDLSFLKSRLCEKPRSNEVWFIGSNIRDGVLEDAADYDDFLAQVDRQIDLSKVIYIPHRKESDQYLSEISIRFGMEVRRLKNIIELEFIHADALPVAFISFSSSALDTIDILAKSPTTVFRIPNTSIQEAARNTYNEVYNAMAHKGFNIIELNTPKMP